MSDPQPLFRMRSDESRRAWLEGWLSAYRHISEELIGNKKQTSDILANSFRQHLKDLRKGKA